MREQRVARQDEYVRALLGVRTFIHHASLFSHA